MKTKHTIRNASQLATRLQRLRKIRRKRIIQIRVNREKRQTLTKNQRDKIFMKTDGRCHICGGKIFKDEAWQADHVIAHAQGGTHKTGNYLPAHAVCNSSRRSYDSEEFQWILKLGVWMRTQIEQEDARAIELAERFVKKEIFRESRKNGNK